jgi:hypothetical protein
MKAAAAAIATPNRLADTELPQATELSVGGRAARAESFANGFLHKSECFDGFTGLRFCYLGPRSAIASAVSSGMNAADMVHAGLCDVQLDFSLSWPMFWNVRQNAIPTS